MVPGGNAAPEREEAATPAVLARVTGFQAPGTPPEGLDLELRAGDIVHLRGGNGAGKSSLLRCLAGLPSPLRCRSAKLRVPGSVAGASGTATADTVPKGHPQAQPDLVAAATLPAASLSVVQMAFQEARDGLVGLTVAGEFRVRRRDDPGALQGLLDSEVAELSSGEARRVALEVARPARVLLLDEPAEGLDAMGLQGLRRLIQEAASGGCVVLADHGGLVADLATRVVDLPGPPRVPLEPLAALAAPTGASAEAFAVPAVIARGIHLPALTWGPGLHALAGPNGSGKSTLLLHAAGLLGKGPRARLGERPAELGASVRLLLPHARDALLRETVDEELRACDPAVASLLAPAGLGRRHPLTLSGGEAQRVALAKVLGVASPVYLLDEPEVHLDGAGRTALRDVLARRRAEGACIVVATHDTELLALADSVTILEGTL